MITPIQNSYTQSKGFQVVTFKKQPTCLLGFLNKDKVSFSSKAKFNEVLCPDIWQGEILKPEVGMKLSLLADVFQKGLAIDFKCKDRVLVGSMANFNYGKASDIDLHLVTDFSQYGSDRRLVGDYFRTKRDMFNYTNNFMIYGHPVELHVEDIAEKNFSQGRYSLQQNKWLSKPVFDEKVVLPDVKEAEESLQIKKSLDACLEKRDTGKISSMFKLIYSLRQSGLEDGGEFSFGNLIFKQLRNEGYIKRMIYLSYEALNNLISLK